MKHYLVWFLLAAFALTAQADEQRTHRVLENPVQDGDLILRVNDGGVRTDAIKIVGSTSATELLARSDSSCGSGNICSGTFACTASSPSGLDSTPSCTTGQFIRLGNVITYSVRITGVDPTTVSTNANFRITLPLTTSNFSSIENGIGNCTTDPGGGVKSDSWVVFAIASTQQAQIETQSVSNTDGRSLYCHLTYRKI